MKNAIAKNKLLSNTHAFTWNYCKTTVTYFYNNGHAYCLGQTRQACPSTQPTLWNGRVTTNKGRI